MTRKAKVPAGEVTVVFEPLTAPVPARAGSEPTPFSATWGDTLWTLRAEAGQLGCHEIVLCVDAPRQAMRRDGGIRADAKVRSEGVEVFLEDSLVGPLRYSCARYTGRGWRGYLPGWQSNVRAVALGLEALRKVERYGLGSGTEQYQGWRALPPGDPIVLGPAAMTLDEAARLLSVEGGTGGYDVEYLPGPRQDRDLIEYAYRAAAKRHHPDAGGDPDTFRQITAARDLLLRG